MRRAETIVANLLEHDLQLGKPLAPKNAVYVLGGNTGVMYDNFEEYAARYNGIPLGEVTAGLAEETIRAAIARGVIFVHQPDHGSLVVYSKGYPVPVTTSQLADMQVDFSVLYTDAVAWANDLRSPRSPVAFNSIFGSVKAMDKTMREHDKLEKQAQKAEKQMRKMAGDTPKREPRKRIGDKPAKSKPNAWWIGPGEWEKEFTDAFPGASTEPIDVVAPKYGDAPWPPPKKLKEHREALDSVMGRPTQAPPDYDLGIIPMRYRQRGVLVGKIAPGSPAASSVLQPGDIIRQAGPFTGSNGNVIGPFRIDKVSELKRVLGWLREGTAFPLKAVRGYGYVDVVILPVRRQ